MKFLDIIIPIYDTKREYLSRALKSIVNQKNIDFKEIGVIVVDDYSKKIIYKDNWFKNNFPILDITFIKNDINIGPGLSRQKGIDLSNAKYVTFLDSDDEFYIHSLEKVIYCLKRENLNRVYTAFYEEVLDNSNMIQLIKHDYRLQCLHGCFLKKEFLIKNDIRFHAKLRYYEDTYFINIIMTVNGNSGYLDEITYIWKYNDKSMVRSTKTKYNHIEEKILSIIDSHNFLLNKNKDNSEFLVNDFIYLYVLLASNVFNFKEYENDKDKYIRMYSEWIASNKKEFEIFKNYDYDEYISQIVENEKTKYSWFKLLDDKNTFLMKLFKNTLNG